MRLASFYILSIALHASALLYPLSFAARGHEQFLRVTILPEAANEGSGTPENGQRGSAPVPSRNTPHPIAKADSQEKKSVQDSQPRPQPVGIASSFNEANAAVFSSFGKEAEVNTSELFNAGGQNNSGFGGISAGAGNSGAGASGAGTGIGAGSGKGSGGTGFADSMALTQVRYRDTPRPDYPESARREGRQGSVLLRVLVDEQGRSKQIEINRSSGSDALDRAATEAIKRWRFIPARYGDQPVESWIRIPIDFSLVDGNAR